MNNIHIIHGIQYLQNTKYNTSFLCVTEAHLLSDAATWQVSTVVSISV